jgi:glycosyltransferase involved in cell wall biosynthesis
MRIGFDISQTGTEKAGCGYFADTLMRSLARIDHDNEYILYPTFGDFYFDSSIPIFCPIRQGNVRYGLRHHLMDKMQHFWRNPPADYEMQIGHPDIIHANNYFCPAKIRNARLVYTLYDLGFVENPKWTTEENRTGCFNGVFNASLYADFIVAISEYSRRYFLDIFPHYPAERIAVVYPASRFSSPGNISKPGTLDALQPEKFWLSVGTLEPRKNHKRLIQAYARLKAHAGKAFPLVLAGSEGWLMGDFQKEIDKLGLRGDVVQLGYVDDTSLQWLYQNCYASLYPSLFEGFGLPVLEAMTLGAPVITSNSTSIPEIVGSAAILVDPMQEEDVFQAMLTLSSNQTYRDTLREKALQQAKSFSWERAAKEVLEHYKKVVQQTKRSASSEYSILENRV